MRELATRTVSGLLYAAIIIAGVYFHPYGLLALLAVILTAGLVEFKHLVKASDSSSIFSTINVLGVFLLWAHLRFTQDFQNHLVAFLVMLITAIIVQWLFAGTKKKLDVLPLYKAFLGIIYIFLPLALAISIVFNKGYWQPYFLIAIFLFLWANDTFAYLTGMAIGKHKLIPHISPKKTIEGLMGGIIGTLLTAYVISHFWTDLDLLHLLVLGALVAASGTIGDLFESALKRAADVKDAGNLIPGHGGILDRLDSFLISVPVAYFYLHFFA